MPDSSSVKTVAAGTVEATSNPGLWGRRRTALPTAPLELAVAVGLSSAAEMCRLGSEL